MTGRRLVPETDENCCHAFFFFFGRKDVRTRFPICPSEEEEGLMFELKLKNKFVYDADDACTLNDESSSSLSMSLKSWRLFV